LLIYIYQSRCVIYILLDSKHFPFVALQDSFFAHWQVCWQFKP